MSEAGGPTAYKVGGYTITHHVASGIGKASFDTGVSFSYLMAQAGKESSFRPDVSARDSSATGLFQFTEQTWLEMLRRHGSNYGLDSVTSEIYRGSDGLLTAKNPDTLSRLLDMRKDPNLSALMAGEYAKSNKNVLEQALGRKVDDTDLYIAHFLGPIGAKNILQAKASNPGQSAADVIPNAADQNPTIFFTSDNKARSVAQFYERINRAFSHPMRAYANFENEPFLQKHMRESPPDPDWPFEAVQRPSVAAVVVASSDKTPTIGAMDEAALKPPQQILSPSFPKSEETHRVSAARIERTMPPQPVPSHVALMPQPPDEIAPAWPFETASWSAKSQIVGAPPEPPAAPGLSNAALIRGNEGAAAKTASLLAATHWTGDNYATTPESLSLPAALTLTPEIESFSMNAPQAFGIINQITAYNASSSLLASPALADDGTGETASHHGQADEGARRVNMPMPPPAIRVEDEKKTSALDKVLQSVRQTLLG